MATTIRTCDYDVPVPRFTGKERDSESGLDYFGARYYSPVQGRFTTVDPSMLSAVKANPQSWNRYSYALNNPLKYVDPNGEDWVASGNPGNPFNWVDECRKNDICYETVAALAGGAVTVYGSLSAEDIRVYTANTSGMIDVLALSGHADAMFESIQTAGREENYLAPGQAAALFNVAAGYDRRHPGDYKLVFTAGSTETGGSAVNSSGRPVHPSTHQGGVHIDLRYMGSSGRSLVGATAAGSGDVKRNQLIMELFAGQKAGLGAAVTGDPAIYGLGPIDSIVQSAHASHMHFQRSYPPPPKEEGVRAKPGAR